MNSGDEFSTAPSTICPICGEPASTVPEFDDCPRCGRNSWFVWSEAEERVLRPRGDLIIGEPIDRFLDAVKFQPGDRLVLDLVDVRCIASEALGRLLTLRKRLLDVQGRLILRRLDPDLLEILRVTLVDSFFEMET